MLGASGNNGDHDGEEEEDMMEGIGKASDRTVEDEVCQVYMDTKLRRRRNEEERPGDGGYADVGATRSVHARPLP
jgi:hypothetical protein